LKNQVFLDYIEIFLDYIEKPRQLIIGGVNASKTLVHQLYDISLLLYKVRVGRFELLPHHIVS